MGVAKSKNFNNTYCLFCVIISTLALYLCSFVMSIKLVSCVTFAKNSGSMKMWYFFGGGTIESSTKNAQKKSQYGGSASILLVMDANKIAKLTRT